MKEKIDILLTERKLVDSRNKTDKRIENALEVQAAKSFSNVCPRGLKLDTTLKKLSISVKGKIYVDISTRVVSFTD